jgi:hypothetical protein
MSDKPVEAPELGDLLTPDDNLLHAPRWEGETRDSPIAIRSLAKLHGLAADEVIEEQENWYDFVDDMCKMTDQLTGGV